jgi:tetratricopeptide (TPR) repeat protein
MKRHYKPVAAFLIALAIGCGFVRAQEMPVTASGEARELFLKAREAHQVSWFEKANDLFRESMSAGPDIALAHAYAAVLDYLLYHDPAAQAARARELATSLPPEERRMVDALVLYSEQDYRGAEAALKDVLTKYPGDPYARHRLGAAQVSGGRPEEGVETLRALLHDRPDYPGAWNHLGYGLLALERTEEALDAFRSFIAVSPGNPSAHHSYAEALVKAGEVDAAIGHLTRAVLLEPRFAYAWLHMGVILQEEGSEQEALAAYRRAEQVSELYGTAFREAVQRRIDQIQAKNGTDEP